MSELGNVEGHAFISYVREDSLRVDYLQRVLEAAGVRVWRDTANLWPGGDWRAEIRRAITTDALVFLACFSRNSVARSVSYQNEELTLAVEQLRLRRLGEPWLIPVRFDNANIPDIDIGGGRTLSSIQCADLFGTRSAETTERLVKVVLRLLGQSRDSTAGDGAEGSLAGSQRARELARSAPISDKPAKIAAIRSPHAVSAVAFSPDATRLALGCDRRLALVTDLTGREQLRVRHGGLIARVWAVAFDHEGRRLATACNDHTARIWHTATGGQLLHIPHAAVVYGVAFSPDGRLLATGAGDKAARIWDTTTGGQLLEVAHTDGDGVLGVAFSSDGRLLATGSDDKTARIWDTATGYQLLEVTHSDKVRAVSFSLAGRLLATGSSDKTARIWDTTTGSELLQVTHGANVWCVALSLDGRLLATAGGSDCTARIWDTTTGSELLQVTHGANVWCVALSQDGRLLATGSSDKTAQVWRLLRLAEDDN